LSKLSTNYRIDKKIDKTLFLKKKISGNAKEKPLNTSNLRFHPIWKRKNIALLLLFHSFSYFIFFFVYFIKSCLDINNEIDSDSVEKTLIIIV
jgi:hypothetical protein